MSGLGQRAFLTLRILPRISRIADSARGRGRRRRSLQSRHSTMKISHSEGVREEQSALACRAWRRIPRTPLAARASGLTAAFARRPGRWPLAMMALASAGVGVEGQSVSLE